MGPQSSQQAGTYTRDAIKIPRPGESTVTIAISHNPLCQRLSYPGQTHQLLGTRAIHINPLRAGERPMLSLSRSDLGRCRMRGQCIDYSNITGSAPGPAYQVADSLPKNSQAEQQ